MRVAAIDVGTNSVHLLVADVGADGEITIVEKSREQVELGRGSLNGNRLTDEAIERGVAALVSFKQATDLLNVETIEAAATSAVREAKNGSEFCRIVRERTGIHVRRIDGADEARLVWFGVRPDLNLSRGPALVADIGGGSVELVLGDAHGIMAAHSLPLGHIRLSERFVSGDPPDIEELRAVRKQVRSKLEPAIAAVPAGLPGPFVGTSGSIRTLARMATMMRGHPEPVDEHGLVLERLELKALLTRFTELPRAKLAELPGMDPRRKATLPTAAAVLYQLMKSFGREHIVTSERSLRDGLLADWIERHRPELTLQRTVSQPRMRAVVRMQERFEVDQEHAEQVRALAVSLFDGLADLHGLGVEARRLLEFACLVHDVGHHIDARDHNKHGHYLILHSRLPAFTAPEIAILANVVKYHRGSRPKRSNRQFASLNRQSQRKVEVLAAILRLADALDRSQHQPVREVRVQIDETDVTIEAVAREDAFLERWAAERRAGVLGSVIGRPVRVVLVQDGPASLPLLPATADQVQQARMDTSESTEDVDRLLAKARADLEEFEDNVDRKRLMKRLRSSSPAHPVLLFRFLFGVLFVLCVATAVTLMAIATFNDEFARTMAKFEGVIAMPLPEEIPVLPALFGLLALTMALAWATATLAALSLGREAQLLPWERKEHQNIVNEITRLTTQRAVMDRIKGTPAGARPRIATPVPVGNRVRSSPSSAASPSSTSPPVVAAGPTADSRAPHLSGSPTYTSSTPAAGSSAAAGTPGFTARRGSLGSRLSAAAESSAPLASAARPSAPLARPAPAPIKPAPLPALEIDDQEPEDLSPDDDTAAAGGVRLGGPAPALKREDDDERTVPSPPNPLSDAAYRDLLEDSRPVGAPVGNGVHGSPAANVTPGGILGRARAGVVGLRSTPFGSAGRVRPPGLVSTQKAKTPVTAPLATPPPAGKPRPRLVSRPNPIDRATAPLSGSRAAGTAVAPIPAAPKAPVLPTMPPPLGPPADVPVEEVVVMEEEEDELPTATGGDPARRRPPAWGPIHEDWLKDAIDKADVLLRSFPQQAYLSYSQEPHLPFTLVIARAAPAAAVRAMASFVDFLASIATPPRARIELVGVAHLDRSFHKNVEAALEPHFGGNVDIEANPGRVDIRFTDPDPQWGSHPVLPLA